MLGGTSRRPIRVPWLTLPRGSRPALYSRRSRRPAMAVEPSCEIAQIETHMKHTGTARPFRNRSLVKRPRPSATP
jgi:hypothetical protein